MERVEIVREALTLCCKELGFSLEGLLGHDVLFIVKEHMPGMSERIFKAAHQIRVTADQIGYLYRDHDARDGVYSNQYESLQAFLEDFFFQWKTRMLNDRMDRKYPRYRAARNMFYTDYISAPRWRRPDVFKVADRRRKALDRYKKHLEVETARLRSQLFEILNSEAIRRYAGLLGFPGEHGGTVYTGSFACTVRLRETSDEGGWLCGHLGRRGRP